MTWELLSNIIAIDPYTCAVYANKHDYSTPQDGSYQKDMEEQQEDSSEPSRNQNTDKPRHQENINMHREVPREYSHALQLDIQNSKNKRTDAIDLELTKSRNTKYSKIVERLFKRKIRLGMLPRDIKISEYILSLMSSIVENSKQGLWQMDILPRNIMKLSIQELFL